MKHQKLKPQKRLLRPIHPQNKTNAFKSIVERNRALFLQYAENKHPLPKIKASLWNGTALHLLELGAFISRDMHQAANQYLRVSHDILQTGPQGVSSQLGMPRRSQKIPFHARPYNPERELATETQWRDLTQILEEEGVKKILDNLKDDQDLPTLEYLMETEAALMKLQKGLLRLQNYLAEINI